MTNPAATAAINLAWRRLRELEEIDRHRARVRDELVAALQELETEHRLPRRVVARELGVNESTLRHHISAASKAKRKERVPA